MVPSARMVVIEDEATMTSAVRLAKALVDDASLVQLLVPAKLPRRLTEVERERRDRLSKRQAERKNLTHKLPKPRLELEEGISFPGSTRLLQLAAELKLQVVLHGRTAGARDGPHDWRRAGARFEVRIQENGHDRVRSAKVATRVWVSALIACEAEVLAGAVQSVNPEAAAKLW